jgi:hypothetical protein
MLAKTFFCSKGHGAFRGKVITICANIAVMFTNSNFL